MTTDKMTRRRALERTTVLIGGLLTTSIWTGVLQGCQAPTERNWTPKYLTEEEALVTGQLIDVLLPRTDSPGASDAGVHRFIDEMLYGYFDPQEQQTIKAGLQVLQEDGFSDLSDAERIAMVRDLSHQDNQQDADSFFQMMRSMTLLGYFTSEIGATETLVHDPIPGAYEGCIPLTRYGGKTWSES